MISKAITSSSAGSLILIHGFYFPQKIKPKYIVTLELWDNGYDDIIAVLTTSNMEHRKWKGALYVQKGKVDKLSDDTLILCADPRILKKHYFTKATFKCALPADIFEQVKNKLQFTRDPFMVLRVRGVKKFP